MFFRSSLAALAIIAATPALADADLSKIFLDVTFKEGDIAVFTLQGLPHVIQACQDDIFEAPLSDLREHLAPTAVEYFPSLAR